MLAALAAVLVLAPGAHAGTYDVYACGTPAGRFANHSWVASVPAGFTVQECSMSDPGGFAGIRADEMQNFGGGVQATLAFTAPAGATIANFLVRGRMYQLNTLENSPGRERMYGVFELGGITLVGGGHYETGTTQRLASHGAWLSLNDPRTYWDTGDSLTQPASYSEAAGYRGDASRVRFALGCYDTPCVLTGEAADAGNRGQIWARMNGATVTVNDPTAPAVTRIASKSGLTADGPVGGDEPLTFDAADNSGIKRAELLDVTPGGAPKVVAGKDFACDYTYASPCPQPANQQIVPAGVTPGVRTFLLRVTDAAGNSGDSAPFTANVGGALNGTNASAAARVTASFTRNRRRSIDVGFGRRASISGRVQDATGAPIGAAVVQVLDRELKAGTSYRVRTEVTTDAAGRFTVRPGPGAARSIRFEYRARRELAAANATATVSMRVAAGSTLQISPRRVRPRGTITISGRLKGTPLPRSGKVVDLQAYEGGKWRTFDTVRARKGARFTSRYRFLRAGSGASFLIRARIRRDDSYPYYLGYSPRVRVRVR
jgi:hypothetical protein